jgi:hypothetical protein
MDIHQQKSNKVIYTINLERHLSCLLTGLVFTVAYIGFIFYFDEPGAFKFATVFYTVCIIPMGLLHLEYYSLNKDWTLIIDNANGKLIIKEKNKSVEFYYNEIEKVEFVHSAFTIFSGYFYYKIKPIDKDVYIFTSLIVDLMVFANFKEKLDERFVLFPLT